MKRKSGCWGPVPLLFVFIAAASFGALAAAPEQPGVAARSFDFGPLLFEENRGQASPEAKYVVRGNGDVLMLTPTGLTWAIQGPAPEAGSSRRWHLVRLELEGIGATARLEGDRRLPSRISYLRGADPDGWLTNVPVYAGVRYAQAYPGIDLRVFGRGGRLEYDFAVSPGADPGRIRWKVTGASALAVDPEGNLRIETPFGDVQQLAPRLFQDDTGSGRQIEGHFELLGGDRFGFQVGPYDRSRTLTIDPVIGYSTYWGATRDEVPGGIATDADGNVYVSGNTGSMDFPLLNPFQDTFAGGGTPNGDVFVTKFSESGNEVIYSTYIGGAGTDIGREIAVDSQGRAVVTGTTFSGDFPSTAGSFQPACSGQCPFVVRLDPDGAGLSYATFIGRGDGTGIGVDSSDQVTITGRTSSSTFPVKNAFQPALMGAWEAFVSKLNASGSALVFSTYLGGSDDENLGGKPDLTVDADGNVYVVGKTESADFPLKSAVQGAFAGEEDAFISRFSPAGALLYSTYLGGNDEDAARGVAVDADGNAHVVGITLSLDFPTQSPFQAVYGGGAGIGDIFVSKIAADGSGLMYSTYLGGQLGDWGNDIAVDELGRAVVAGNGASNFPVHEPLRAFDGIDNVVVKLSPDGSELVYSTPIGAADQDIFVTTFGTDVITTGNIASGAYPVLKAIQPRRAGGTDVFLTHLSDMGTLYFAQFANGGEGASILSELLLTGSSTETTADATVKFRGDDGLPLPLEVTVVGGSGGGGQLQIQEQVSELVVQVPPQGAVRISTDGQGPVRAGSVTVDYNSPIGGVIRFTINPLGTTGVADSQLLSGFISPVRKTAINTGVALYNTEDKQIGITMRLRDLDGVQIPGGLRVLAMGPKEHLAKFIDELFGNADLDNFEGTITVDVTTPDALIAATALELGGNPGEFTTLPVTPIP